MDHLGVSNDLLPYSRALFPMNGRTKYDFHAVSIRSFTFSDSTVLDCFEENLRTCESSLFASTTWTRADESWQWWIRETNVDSCYDPFVSFVCQDCRLGRVNVCKVPATNCSEHRCSTNSERSILDDSSAPLSCLPRPMASRTKCET